MDYFTCLFPSEKLNSRLPASRLKEIRAIITFLMGIPMEQNKISHKKIYKQTNLKKGFKTASKTISILFQQIRDLLFN